MKQTVNAREIARQICPPVVWSGLQSLRTKVRGSRSQPARATPTSQELDLYWDSNMAALLDTWGADSVWKEIQLLFVGRTGTALDIACGTGRVIEILSDASVEVHGCDISPLLVGKARERGILESRLTVCDATTLPYADDTFDFAYSIGSLEHFTEEGISKFLAESHRATRVAAFHNIPVSRSGTEEGWISPYQSYFNNSVAWWLTKFRAEYPKVTVLDSTWSDTRSLGAWFICEN